MVDFKLFLYFCCCFPFGYRLRLGLRFLILMAVKIRVPGKFLFLDTWCIHRCVFFIGYGAGIDDICDWFLREKIREDTYIVVRDRKVSLFFSYFTSFAINFFYIFCI